MITFQWLLELKVYVRLSSCFVILIYVKTGRKTQQGSIMFHRMLVLPSSGQTHNHHLDENLQTLFDLQIYVQ